MHRIPKIFANSSNRRKAGADAGKPKPRLERLNARKNIDYEFCPASSSPSCYSSEESLRNRSGDLYSGKTSFRVDGNDVEIESICRELGFSGIDDFAIPAEEYEAMKARLSAPVVFSHKIERLIDREVAVNCDEDVELSDDSGGIGVTDAISSQTERNNSYIGLTENGDDVVGQKSEERQDLGNVDGDRANLFGSRLMDNVRVSDTVSGRSNEVRGKGIKGARPPVLASPPFVPLPVIDKDCSTWDILRAFAPDSETTMSGIEWGLLLNEAGVLKQHEDGDHEEDKSRRVMAREDNCRLSGSCSFTTNSHDDDSSSTSTDPISSMSSDGRFRRVILEWQKGELLGCGSFGSVYEGIADNGFFFALKEVSLLDQGDEGRQRIIQLEQEIALLSQFEHENIVQYYGTKRDESHLYIFLELVTKGSLLSLYQKYILRDSQVSAYTRQILHGLKYLHDRNVVHRDIKCANILVDGNGLVKLADFGLAKATKLNDVNSCKGTAFWMAPEVVRCQRYGLAADIWSLGCTVLEMLTGRFPYHNLECMPALFRIGSGERPPIPDSLSSCARGFILKCLQVDPRLRPSAAQLLDHPFVKRPLPSFSGLTSPQYFVRQI